MYYGWWMELKGLLTNYNPLRSSAKNLCELCGKEDLTAEDAEFSQRTAKNKKY
jgi:hypothetical protein